jgi:hypothetical protein
MRLELSANGTQVPVVGAPPDVPILEIQDRHTSDRPFPAGRCQTVEFARVGSAHLPLKQALPVVFERSDRFDTEIREGAEEAGCPAADPVVTSIDDPERNILVRTIVGKEPSQAFDVVSRPGSGPFLSK